MASDYLTIRSENERKFGTEVGRICQLLMADRYDDRTHFIYELLQNADDALARRAGWDGSRAVDFRLFPHVLYVSHFGVPFDKHDVGSICGLGESTKEQTAIGRFGIGFKSVYAFTDRPEVHSGREDFVIENFVWPVAADPLERDSAETVFVLPLNAETDAPVEQITRGFQQLGVNTLLFLRQIEEITWQVESGPSGCYLRGKPEQIDDWVRRVTLLGQETGRPEVEESWLVFSRQVMDVDSSPRGYVEIAFLLETEQQTASWSIKPIRNSPLVVYFPTVLETNLGVLLQGPYITTPSRDNVPRDNPWNQQLVGETALLLVEALRWLRDYELLDVTTLHCLPLDQARFSGNNMFAPLFEAAREALKSESLLPCFGGGYVPATRSRLARTQELRELFSPQQLTDVFGEQEELFWLSPEITQDRTPELRRYLINELDVPEVTPETILSRLDKSFLEAQPDEWIIKLYEFLSNQRGLRTLTEKLPLIRLEDGAHVLAYSDGIPQAFLPSSLQTGFPTVRRAICTSDRARTFLQSIGIKEPDPVDDVIQNLLPKYSTKDIDVDEATYESDIRRILVAFKTDSTAQRARLIELLRESYFVIGVDSGTGSKYWERPTQLYLHTKLLLDLFSEVAGVLFVDYSVPCLSGGEGNELLKTCGASEHLEPVSVSREFSPEESAALRRAGGCEDCTGYFPSWDYTLRGLQPLLDSLLHFDPQTRIRKAGLLWQALCDLEKHSGQGAFLGIYWWQYHRIRSVPFDAAFIEKLNNTAWIPNSEGYIEKPELITFDTLGWEPNSFLQSKIHFRSSVVEALAHEAGLEPGLLELLRKSGITTEQQLANLLASSHPSNQRQEEIEVITAEENAVSTTEEDSPDITRSYPLSTPREVQYAENPENLLREGKGPGASNRREVSPTPIDRTEHESRQFISYVGAHPDTEEPDPDSLRHLQRQELEERAIELVLACEPELCRTPANNPGYDLFERGEDDQPARWIEVKAMSGSLYDRPVGMSSVQFECARLHGEAFWLYVIEHVLDNDKARVVRIQNPANRAQTFTFDHGWLDVALFEIP